MGQTSNWGPCPLALPYKNRPCFSGPDRPIGSVCLPVCVQDDNLQTKDHLPIFCHASSLWLYLGQF